MALEYLNELALNRFIQLALAEDIGEGDFSSLASIPVDVEESAQLIVKDEGIIAGVNIAERIMLAVDSSVKFNRFTLDGKKVKHGDIAFTVEGKAQSIVKAERLMLNCMQRMSGIATYTAYLNSLIEGTKAKLLDTRKTTPNFRIMEKWAVVIGGGVNHRFGLFDMIMLKDNHIDYAGGVEKAIRNTQEYLKEKNKDLEIIVETRDLEEVKKVLSVGGVKRILLDNMSNDMLKEAVALIGDQCESEASGGITEETIGGVAKTGVDYISVGALTHSFESLDMSLKAIK